MWSRSRRRHPPIHHSGRPSCPWHCGPRQGGLGGGEADLVAELRAMWPRRPRSPWARGGFVVAVHGGGGGPDWPRRWPPAPPSPRRASPPLRWLHTGGPSSTSRRLVPWSGHCDRGSHPKSANRLEHGSVLGSRCGRAPRRVPRSDRLGAATVATRQRSGSGRPLSSRSAVELGQRWPPAARGRVPVGLAEGVSPRQQLTGPLQFPRIRVGPAADPTGDPSGHRRTWPRPAR